MATLNGNSVNLATALAGSGQTTNVGYRGAPDGGTNQNPAMLRIVTAVGATPTCTYQIEGSADNADWYPIDYADVAASAVNSIAIGATGVAAYNNNSAGVNLTIAGGTVTVIAINGTATGLTSGTFFVPAGGTVTVTYSVTPTTFVTSAAPVIETWGRGTFTITTATTKRLILRALIPWSFVRVTMSANTNVTNTIDVFFFRG
jgi:hypothetical protein